MLERAVQYPLQLAKLGHLLDIVTRRQHQLPSMGREGPRVGSEADGASKVHGTGQLASETAQAAQAARLLLVLCHRGQDELVV